MAAAGAPAPLKHEFVAAGGFGLVLKPALPNINPATGAEVEYPGNVTKIFYTEEELNSALRSMGELERLMGGRNRAHEAHPYRKSYRVRNFSSKEYNRRILSTLTSKALFPGNYAHVLRMPDLGIDVSRIGSAELDQLRQIPFQTILEQIRKVFFQIQNLTSNRYIHTDVRETNIMIHPLTGTISIIDFDWLKPYDVLFEEYFPNFGYFANPPECLLLKRFPNPVSIGQLFDVGISAFGLIMGIPKPVLDSYIIHNNKLISDKVRFRTELSSALLDNVKYLRENANAAETPANNFINIVFPTFDNYGLATTLLILLKKAYNINPIDMPGDIDTLAHHLMGQGISKNGVAYTEDEFKRIADALIDLVGFLRRVGSMKLRERLQPVHVVDGIDKILGKFKEPAAAPMAAAAAAMGGAGAAAPVHVPVSNNEAIRQGIAAAMSASGPNFGGGARRVRRTKVRRIHKSRTRKN
jgi:hypothetical protein